MQLLYYPAGFKPGQPSPFDQALQKIVRSQKVDIVSPFIGVRYLKGLLENVEDWRLITDYKDWLSSHHSYSARMKILEFIKKHKEKIRFYEGLHAKVVLSPVNAFLGSANLTKKGMSEREEMAVFIDDPEKVLELSKWFTMLWKQRSRSLPINEIELFLKEHQTDFEIQEKYRQKHKKKFPFKASLVNFSDKNLNVEQKRDFQSVKTFEMHEQQLIKAIRSFRRNREWMEQYFDLVRDIFLKFNLSEDSVKYPLTIPENCYGGLAVNVGPRYILKPYFDGYLEFIMPMEFEKFVKNYKNAKKGWEFSNIKNFEDSFGVIFNMNSGIYLDSFMQNFWYSAVEKEIEKNYKASKAQKSHNPAYYRSVMDSQYREKTFDVVFS